MIILIIVVHFASVCVLPWIPVYTTAVVVIVIHYGIHCCGGFVALCNLLVLILFGLPVQMGTTFANGEGLTMRLASEEGRDGREGGRLRWWCLNVGCRVYHLSLWCVVDNCLVLVSFRSGWRRPFII